MSTIRPLQSHLATNGIGAYTPNAGGTSSTLVGMPPPTQASSGTSNLEVYDEGILLTPGATVLDFTGAGVTATAVGTAVTVNVPAATITTQDEGVTLSSTVNTLNFVGSGVTASGAGATTTVTINGGGFAPSGFTSTVTAAGTTTLTNTSTEVQYFTGTTTQTVVLPVVGTLVNGWSFTIVNQSNGGNVTVQTSGGSVLYILPQFGGWATFRVINTAGASFFTTWAVESGFAYYPGFDASIRIGSNVTDGIGSANVTIGESASSTANGVTTVGAFASVSGLFGTAVGKSATVDVPGGVALGSFATTNAIADSLAFNATNSIVTGPADTAHALSIDLNAASVTSAGLGVTLNGASGIIPVNFTTQEEGVSLSTAVQTLNFVGAGVTASGAGATTTITIPGGSGGAVPGYTSTATAAGTTTLTNASTATQRFSGATTQTCVLPVVTTLANGWEFVIFNDSTGAVTVQSSGANTITTLAAAVGGVNRGGWGRFICVDTAGGTGVASWSYLSGATIL